MAKKKVKKDTNSYSSLKTKAWKLMSLYVRRKGEDSEGFNVCYTCGSRKHYKELQAGHFWHNKLDFDERNLKPQCPRCNTYLSGNLAVYAIRLLKELGADGMNKLDHDAHTIIYSRQELLKVISHLRELVKDEV